MVKIYTKTGDDGTTGLLYGGRISKADPRTDAYGTTDEAVAVMGLARSLNPKAEGLGDLLLDLQRQLFVVGAELATDSSNKDKLQPGVSKVTDEMVSQLEQRIDDIVTRSPLPDYFVVPGNNQVSAVLDLARSVVRRAERAVVALVNDQVLEHGPVVLFLNRLSDLLFALARYEESAGGTQAPRSRT